MVKRKIKRSEKRNISSIEKRLTAITLAGVMMAGLAGCGGKQEATTTEEQTTEVTTEEATETVTEEVTTEEMETTTVTEEEVDNSALGQLQKSLRDEKAAVGVAFLGSIIGVTDFKKQAMELYEAAGYKDKYPDMELSHFVQQPGTEVYLLIPQNKNETISIMKYGFDEETGEPREGERIFSSDDGMPIILICNESDIMPNIIVELGVNKQVYKYNPCMSLENNTLQTTMAKTEGTLTVEDLTIYEEQEQ